MSREERTTLGMALTRRDGSLGVSWSARGQYRPRKLQSIQLNRNASPVIWSFGQRTVDLIRSVLDGGGGVDLNIGIDYKQLTCGGRDLCMS